MLVKCRICGKKVEKKEAFKVVVGGKNAYYCDKEEYDAHIKEQTQKGTIYEICSRVLGARSYNSSLIKEVGKLCTEYGSEAVCDYLTGNEDYLTKIIESKDFTSDYGKIRYFSVCIENNLKNKKIEPQAPDIKIQYDNEVVHMKYKRRLRRKCIAELEYSILKEGE